MSQECPERCKTVIEPDRILIYTDMFEFDKSGTHPETGAIVLSMIKQKLGGVDPKKLEITEIIGYTDPIGKKEHNQPLSEKRAKAIEAALRSKLEEKKQMPHTKVYGLADSQPLTEVQSICRSLYPNAEHRLSPNFNNIVRCFGPLRRVEIRVKPLAQTGNVGALQRKDELPAPVQVLSGEKIQ
ncbi:hypothetical protein NK8_63550 (plasmid) [Caballeronia sp. NK8]|nr:hypothetical protein NK8_63550 [Caballeronia sp. NK8]